MTSKKTTSKQVAPPHPNGELPNPTGKGGFVDHPENRSNGRWKKEESISYQYNRIMRMTRDEITTFVPETMAQEIALARIKRAVMSDGLNDAKEIADRTEGKAPQFIGLGGTEEYRKALVEFVGGGGDNK